MDVLKPPLIYVNGRCYRVNNPDFDSFDTKHSSADWEEQPSSYGKLRYISSYEGCIYVK